MDYAPESFNKEVVRTIVVGVMNNEEELNEVNDILRVYTIGARIRHIAKLKS